MAKRRNCYVNFLREPEVALFAKTTGDIATAANAQQDFFWVGGNKYFELAQGVGATGANTLLAANGLTPAANGWLLTCDDTATDSIEITRGITLGSAQSFTTGTDAFFMRTTILVNTLATVTHLMVGFRELAAYVTANTLVECLTAYDDKALMGIRNNAGAVGSQVSLATVDTATSATHAAITAGDVVAFEVSVSEARAVTFKIGHATPTGATEALMEVARVAAIADLATDTLLAAASALTPLVTAQVMVPTIIMGASGGGAPDHRLVSFEAGLLV